MINKITRLCLLALMFVIFPHVCIAIDDDDRPPEHICPIALAVMRDPVVAADGHSYEREDISKWLLTSKRSPITNAELENLNLTPNLSLKKMINDWKPGRQHEPSVLESRSASDIAGRVRSEFERNSALLHSAKDRDIVAFLGNTGAGKSTLVNLLAGKKLVVTPDEDEYVLADPTDQTAMAIGIGGGSETLYPKSIDIDGLLFFDFPGFNDTDGSERNLVNAAFMRQILLEAASVRFVFVAGQDQFIADRGASIKQMFNSIKQLFVVSEQERDLVNEGVFVATKVTSNEQADMVSFLLRRTDSKDKEELNAQLQSWAKQDKLCRMLHPMRKEDTASVRDQVLSLIKKSQAAKVRGINVSVLYPPATVKPLERMFENVLQERLDHRFGMPLTTLTDYDNALTLASSQDFWKRFDTIVCTDDKATSLLKEFCINPYNKAMGSVERENATKLQDHIQSLKDRKQKRIEDIKERTEGRAREVISSLVPRQTDETFVSFDFGYHPQIHQQVCGAECIGQLATDLSEQEVARQAYAEFISRHAHEQMMAWQERFSGIDALTKRIALLEEKDKESEKKSLKKK